MPSVLTGQLNLEGQVSSLVSTQTSELRPSGLPLSWETYLCHGCLTTHESGLTTSIIKRACRFEEYVINGTRLKRDS